MFYCIYKITNKINGKIYIGSHKTKNLDDNYMGSGKYLKYAQEKYGIENFTKEILFVYDNPESMYIKEAEIVNEDFLSTENTYNLKIGGFGGWDYLNSGKVYNSSHSSEHSKMMTEKRLAKYSSEQRKLWGQLGGKLAKEKKLGFCDPLKRASFSGKKHTEETKKKMSVSAQGKHNCEKNSQFGSMWITDGTNNKKIKKNDIIPEGWKKGRVASW